MGLRSVISPLNLILTPVKQHLGCCVVAPLLLKLAGATALAQTIVRNEQAEFLFLLCVMPPAVFGILKLEDFWRARHEKNHAAHHDPCDTHCAHKSNALPLRYLSAGASFKKRFWINLAFAAGLAFVLHLTLHHHH